MSEIAGLAGNQRIHQIKLRIQNETLHGLSIDMIDHYPPQNWLASGRFSRLK